MVRSIGAQIGLLAFAVAVIAGLYAGNSATVILTRALTAMVLGALVGQMSAWAAKQVLRDYLQRKKLEMDREHVSAIRSMMPPPEEEPTAVTTEPQEVG